MFNLTEDSVKELKEACAGLNAEYNQMLMESDSDPVKELAFSVAGVYFSAFSMVFESILESENEKELIEKLGSKVDSSVELAIDSARSTQSDNENKEK